MKHLLTAALIATALAAPVRGDDLSVSLNCVAVGVDSGDSPIEINTNPNTWDALIKEYAWSSGHDATLVFSNENYVAWLISWHMDVPDVPKAHYATLYMLDRQTMYLQQAGVSNSFTNSPNTSFRSSNRWYHCSQSM